MKHRKLRIAMNRNESRFVGLRFVAKQSLPARLMTAACQRAANRLSSSLEDGRCYMRNATFNLETNLSSRFWFADKNIQHYLQIVKTQISLIVTGEISATNKSPGLSAVEVVINRNCDHYFDRHLACQLVTDIRADRRSERKILKDTG